MPGCKNIKYKFHQHQNLIIYVYVGYLLHTCEHKGLPGELHNHMWA